MKILIYDFDGTITPYSMPKYELLNRCSVSYDDFNKRVVKYMYDNKVNMYDAYYHTLFNLMIENKIDININNICLGASGIELNKGVVDYFKRHNGYKHYVVTSGLKDYINATKISKYLSGIYGVTINYNENNSYIDKLLTDKDKVNAIKDIIKANNANGDDIVYFGDGLTDKYAFSYVHKIGGETVFIDNRDNCNLVDDSIIDFIFKGDYSINSSIDNYVKNLEIK